MRSLTAPRPAKACTLVVLLFAATSTFPGAVQAQVLSINLVGNNKVVDVGSHLFDTGRPIVTLCAGVDYTLEGNYSLLGVCSNVPPFSATLTADGNAIYSPSGLNDTYSVPIPISVTSIVGNHDFTVFFKGGTYSSGASCADVLNFGLPDSSFSVAVLNCTHPLAAFPPAAAPEAALAEAAAGAPQPSSDLQARLAAHRVYIRESVQAAADAAANKALEQFG